MDYSKLIHDMNETWSLKRVSFDKSEIAYLSNKDTFQGRRLGFLTTAYHQREKLIRSSEIYFAYVFQTWTNAVSEKGTTYPTWMLFSPEKSINENPAILKDICAKVQSIRDVKPTEKNEKSLKKYIEEYLSDVSYFVIPDAYSCGHFIYRFTDLLFITARSSFQLHTGTACISHDCHLIFIPQIIHQ